MRPSVADARPAGPCGRAAGLLTREGKATLLAPGVPDPDELPPNPERPRWVWQAPPRRPGGTGSDSGTGALTLE
jgi:hypothetical protein